MKIKLFLIAIVSLLISEVAFAQIDTTSNKIALLEQRIEQLEKNTRKNSVDWDKINRYAHPSGYVQLGYNWADDNTSTFKITRAMFTLSGNLYKGDYGKVDYKFQVNFAGTPKILDLFACYMPVKEFGVKFGQYKSPLTYENQMRTPVTLEFVNYALAIERFARMSDRDIAGFSAAGRDMGIDFLGSAIHKDGFSVINYDLAIFNGYKINSTDDNKSKDIVGRLIITPIKPLSLFTYFQRGEGAYPVYNEATRSYTPQTDNKYVKMYRYGGGFSYKADKDKGFARAELIGGKTGGMKSLGAYFAAGVGVAKGLMVVGRIDYVDEDTSYKGIYETNYTTGLLWRPLKNLDLKLNYTYKQIPKGFTDKNCVFFQLTYNY